MSITQAIKALIIISFLAAQPSTFAAAVNCTQCGMAVDMGSKFASKIDRGDTTLYFCDIGDLFSYLNRKKHNAVGAFVKDFVSGEWISATTAYYVHADKKFKTPMGWGVAAFRDKKSAEAQGTAMGFDAAAKALK